MMRIKDIYRLYPDINEQAFEMFLSRSEKYNWAYHPNVFDGGTLETYVDVRVLMKDFEDFLNPRRAVRRTPPAAEQNPVTEEQRKKIEERRAALETMLVSSGFNFEGYRIVRYAGYISGDNAVQIGRGPNGIFSRPGDVGNSLMQMRKTIRQKALAELKEAAYAMGCNAIIGLDFDYFTFQPEPAAYAGGAAFPPYVFGVTANGTAVVIEKTEENSPVPAEPVEEKSEASPVSVESVEEKAEDSQLTIEPVEKKPEENEKEEEQNGIIQGQAENHAREIAEGDQDL